MALEDPAGAAEIVYGCVRWDWRWDSVDERGLYLARLVRDLGLPLGPVVEGLGLGETANERAARVLGLLALGGSGEARDALRAYVKEGEHWVAVLEEMACRWPVEWWDDLAETGRERAERDPEDRWGEPWYRWGLAGPGPVHGSRERKPFAEVDNARLLELLADPEESEERRAAALDVIDDRGPEPGVIPLVPSLGTADGKYMLWPLIGVVDKLGALAVPAAREWAVATEPEWLRRRGHDVLAACGEAEDVPVLVADLERDWVERRWCGPKRTADGLARFGAEARGAVSLLRRLWLWTPHSYERVSYLEALAEIDPTGLESVYVECLWDCEGDARLLGVRHAPDRPEVRERLVYLRDDALEEAEVRAAASERLAALTG
ncbi:hypothetical protein [Streptomyces sp. TLI_053]|uniref:hypothetical protein n=1 Tax=Streptomyces sp. TLI_053 TaxID=1855352 RepID=UPI0013520CF2|nr:hypothetical protein [Streptomyces sp. TLI_053]